MQIPQAHYAHSLPNRPASEWQPLEDHLNQTATLAEQFAADFAPGYGRIAGLWHDIGKYQRAFQDYIAGNPDGHVRGSVDHSSVGAAIARERDRSLLVSLLAFAIAGHHGGMPNAETLAARLEEKAGLLLIARKDGIPAWMEAQLSPAAPDWLNKQTDRVSLSMWTRFIFSALVDADFLDTERFYAGVRGRDAGAAPSLEELKRRLDTYLEKKTADAERTPMNEMRGRVLGSSRTASQLQPGVFTLTVPTGGGKTLASLAFALDHATRFHLSQVIVVIPFTSIIEQTARQFRDALGPESVLEHHTNVDPDLETPSNRLASENWDAPVVVTTSVQFFESLFANKPSRCRKLHRIARSVVVLDEVQTFPVSLLAPVRYALHELSTHFGATTVLCTATQPALLETAREIIRDPESEFAAVAGRCEVLMPASGNPITWENLATELSRHRQVLAIVHRRNDAQVLADLAGERCLHLSARMCAAHRSVVLAEVKRRLNTCEPCQLVATQLVEAGVDVDFPEVYRAFAGVDSLAQAAGRCNREGKQTGRLHIFFAPTQPPRGVLQTAERIARVMWHEGLLNLTDPHTFTEYFARLYRSTEPDARGVMAAERYQRFADVAELFEMISETGEAVVAPYGDWEQRVADVRSNGISRGRMRRLQRFFVNLYTQEITELSRAGALERIADTFWAVVPGFQIYHQRWGFGWKGGIMPEPESLIA